MSGDPSTSRRIVAESAFHLTHPMQAYFESLVPAASSKNTTVRGLNPFDNLNRRVVLCYLLRLAGGYIEHATGIVCAPR